MLPERRRIPELLDQAGVTMGTVDRRRWARILGPWILLMVLLAGGGAWYATEYRVQVMAENERNAFTVLKSLSSAQADFRFYDRDGNGIQDFWTGDLAGLLRFKLISRASAEADGRPITPLTSQPVALQGYYFIALDLDESVIPPESFRQETDPNSGKVHHRTKFGFCAYPAKPGATGRHIFLINENNTVFRASIRDTTVPTNWPSDQELKRAWCKPH
jgi:hypothetical protein